MVVTLAQVSADTGEVYDAVDGGTTAVTSIIGRAEDFVVASDAGTTTAYDTVIRPLADAMVCNQVIGSVDAVNKTIGSLSVGQKDMMSMYNNFMSEARRAAIIKGISLDGYRILMEDSA